MGPGLMGDLKRQASLFLRDKMKRARLVLMDATPAQLLTEEITNGDSCAQDASAMSMISRAAFEVDDYERIVHILHHRLSKFEAWNWRATYKALVLLEYLLTHGPLRISEEFQSDQQTITHMATFQYVDHKGFDWGSCVKEKSDRIMRLLEDRSYLAEERAKARKLSMGIKGFGSFNTDVKSSKDDSDDHRRRRHHEKDIKFDGYKAELVANGCHEYVTEEDHPFWDHKESYSTKVSLLSAI
ncbi:ENTH/VHS family protein isoform 1 [Dorcoceras hygrometricum]|uniref:ENTH/VHS family protein isoform 1 n=1 Tax=Dorcoceras hygrometricum TaxID=472368 RepID=A0A2Z7DEC4_9LAMI|nr:ENTH/VHS family protein isoform 1 [Dorcoceras hygrometricum]